MRRKSVSQAIAALPKRFDATELAQAATTLLRERTDDGTGSTIDVALLQLYIELGVVDAPVREGDRDLFSEHHLLQLTASQILRESGLELDPIATLLRGVDDRHLKMLCDDPQEAASKAAVMRNWLHMLDKGRYARPDRGETRLAHDEGPKPATTPTPTDLAAVLRSAMPVAPTLGHPDPPTMVPAGRPAARVHRATIANVDAARLMATLADAVERPATTAQRPPPVSPARHAEADVPLSQPWRRFRIASGIELHVADHALAAERDPTATAIILERVRRALDDETTR